jgi:hypothetical protein
MHAGRLVPSVADDFCMFANQWMFYASQGHKCQAKAHWHAVCHSACTPAQDAREGHMIDEIELFYLVLLVLLTFIIHVILSATGPRRDERDRHEKWP